MKIAGIFPTKVKQDIEIDLSTEQPLGIAYVMNSAKKKKGYDVALYYGVPDLETLLNFDVIALSLLTKDVPVGLDITKKIKESNSNIKTIVGGPHISGDQNLVLENSIDYGVIGEGEETFVELLKQIEQNKKPNDIKGIVYSESGKVISTERRERINLDGLRPIRVSDFYKIYDASLYYPAPSKRRFIPVLASRGCTMDCEFCQSKLVWNKQIKYRNSSDIISELEELLEDKNKDMFYLDEENPFINKYKIKEIVTSFIGKGYNLASCGDTRLIDSEMLFLLKKAGWTSLLWGIESLDPEIVKREKKGSNPKHVYNILKESEEYGIFNHGFIMIGFDYETEDTILKYAQELPNYPIHQLRITIATPFPGTDFEKRLKQQGVTFNADLSKYDTGHLVYEHSSITPERMKELQHEIVRKFYQSKQWNERMTKMAKDFPHLKQSITEFRDYVLFNKYS